MCRRRFRLRLRGRLRRDHSLRSPRQPQSHPSGRHQSFRADRQQLFGCWNAVANLADKAGTVRIRVEAQCEEGFDPVWLRNAVLEPIEESGADRDEG